MSICHRLAAYVNRASWDQISPEAKGKLKQHMLDSLGCALGAIPNDTMAAIRSENRTVGQTGPCSMIGGGKGTPEYAAFYNSALVSSLPFRDVFLAAGEMAHPADNLPSLLAGAEHSGASGQTLLLGLILAYHIQCRLTASGVTLERRGISDSLTLSIALGAGLSKVFGLSETQTAHAIALCAAESISLCAGRPATKSGSSSLANASAATRAIQNVRLARAGIEGPLDIFEAPSGLEDLLGRKFGIDWDREGSDAILACSLLRFHSDIYSQSCLQAVLELRAEYEIKPQDVQGIHVDLFKAGYDALGGPQSHSAPSSHSVEEAARSLPYLLAVALLDGEVYPDQFKNERWRNPEVHSLAQRTVCWLSLAYTKEFPEKLKCKVRIGLKDGQIFETERDSFDGYFRSPMTVDALLLKFKRLGSAVATDAQLQRIIECVARLEQLPASDLAQALEQARTKTDAGETRRPQTAVA